MAAALIGNIIISNATTNISATTATGTVSSGGSLPQILASNILANPTLGSGNYTYLWSQTDSTITFTAQTSNSTNCSYPSISSGSTTIKCTVTDTWTGIQTVTSDCVITWPTQTALIITSSSGGSGVGGNAGTADDAVTSVTVANGTPPYTFTWTRTAGQTCTLRSSTGTPTNDAYWYSTSTLTGNSTVRCVITDSATPTPAQVTASNIKITWLPPQLL
jgi:hypothetical protein